MPHVITARDGRNHTIFDERDILSLVDEYAGFEIRKELEEWLEEQKALILQCTITLFCRKLAPNISV